MELDFVLADLHPEGVSGKVYAVSFLIMLAAGFASGLVYRAGALAILSFLCFVPMFIIGLISSWTIWQSLGACFVLLIALQAGFFFGAGISLLKSTLKRRLMPDVNLQEASNRDSV